MPRRTTSRFSSASVSRREGPLAARADKEWSNNFKGEFDMGCKDMVRGGCLADQKRLGTIPANGESRPTGPDKDLQTSGRRSGPTRRSCSPGRREGVRGLYSLYRPRDQPHDPAGRGPWASSTTR